MLGIHWGKIGIMDKKMETTIVYWGYIFSLLSGPVNSVYQLDLNEQVSCDQLCQFNARQEVPLQNTKLIGKLRYY